MPNTYTLIASSTVGAGGAASIDFTSIPSTYTDLCLKLSLKNDRAFYFDNYYMQFNGDTAANYSSRTLLGWNTAQSASSGATNQDMYIYGNGANTGNFVNTFGNTEIYIPNYRSSTAKSSSVDGVSEGNQSADVVQALTAQLWTGTSAITSIKLFSVSGNFIQYTTAYLYGVKNA